MDRTIVRVALTALGVLLLAAPIPLRAAGHPFALRSPAFHDGGPLPASVEFNGAGCHGANRLPRLTWSGVPAGTRSFALLLFDPDAAQATPGGWVHGNIYNIPRGVRFLTAATLQRYTLGATSFGFPGFGGPCPPPNGQAHHYIFTLYALNVARVAGPHLTRDRLLAAMDGRVLGATTLVGTFRRA